MHLFRAKTGYGLRCLKYKIAKLWNELDTKLKEETSPTQFKSLLKLVLGLMIKLYSDYWFVTASYILYYGWCLCRPVLVFSPALCTFLLFFAIFWFSFAVLYLYPSKFTYNRQPALMIPGFSSCLCCIYMLFRLLVFKLNMMMMLMKGVITAELWRPEVARHGYFVSNVCVFVLEKRSFSNRRYCADRAQNLPGSAPPHLAHDFPDFIQIGSLLTELLPNAWRPFSP